MRLLSLLEPGGEEIGAPDNNTTAAGKNGYGCEIEGHDSQMFVATGHWQKRDKKVRAEQNSNNPCRQGNQAHRVTSE